MDAQALLARVGLPKRCRPRDDGPMSYQGPAVIISEGQETPAQVRLTADKSERPMRWEGFGEPVQVGRPNISTHELAVIRLPDGREGQAHVAVHYSGEDREASLQIAGAGPAPFDS